jgi:HEPN domain-containing protein
MRPETHEWVALAEEDWAVAQLLLRSEFGRQAVFYTHLAAEKLLKGLIAESVGPIPVPYTHNLPELARVGGQAMPATIATFLGRLSPHCVLARYEPSPGVYTIEYCEELLAPAGEAILWLKQLLN